MKLLKMLVLVLGVALAFGAANAYAVPTVDGALGVGEWANLNASAAPYPYYLEVFDPNVPGVVARTVYEN